MLQPSKEILEQNLEKFHKIGVFPSIFSASCGRKEIGEITLATIGSVINRMIEFKFDHVIVDECHLIDGEGGMYRKLINKLNCII